ncbi:group II truncated hemoglobin [Hyphomicrobium sp.]|uniref:group II truncated hemoglobin n=1 Tax=Hyphomicrobium sp. TaxID=82 RepID=UPI0025BC663D|nr:group II truncated hemoglobin [Hyphomicrobium sp.]
METKPRVPAKTHLDVKCDIASHHDITDRGLLIFPEPRAKMRMFVREQKSARDNLSWTRYMRDNRVHAGAAGLRVRVARSLFRSGANPFVAEPKTEIGVRFKAPQSLYDRIGGEKGVRALVEAFYDIVEHDRPGEILHLLHLRGHGLEHARLEQFRFLSGFLGGPRLYVERYGHSDVRKMHEHVEITPHARDTWLECMTIAIDRVGFAPEVKSELIRYFTRVATVLVNKAQ